MKPKAVAVAMSRVAAPKPTVVLTRIGAKKAATLRCDLLGDDQVSGGVGGWEEVEYGKKNRRQGLAYKGAPAYSVTLPLGFDGISSGRATSVEDKCRRLVELGQGSGKKGSRPPKIRIEGLVRVPGHVEWVIDSITWGTQIRNGAGQRVQQQFELTLIQYRRVRRAKKSPARDAREDDDD